MPTTPKQKQPTTMIEKQQNAYAPPFKHGFVFNLAAKAGALAFLGAAATGCAAAHGSPRANHPVAQVAAPAPAAPIAPAPEAVKPLKVYDLVIDATSDWATVWIEGGRFVRDNEHAFSMETPAGDHLWKLTFSPDKIELFRKQNGSGHVIIKAQIETAAPSVVLVIGHGDNGGVLASSPIDTVTNNSNKGDAQNRNRYLLDLAFPTKKLAQK